jgi:putative oxidoreductase
MSQSSNRSWGLTVLRIVTGVVFVMHGVQKLFIIGIPQVVGFFGQAGIPYPRFFAIVVSLVELFGGAALVLGVATRVAAALLAIDMAVAILKVHLKNGFFLPMGFEFALSMFAANFCLLLAGGGAASVDGLVRNRRQMDKDSAKVSTPGSVT